MTGELSFTVTIYALRAYLYVKPRVIAVISDLSGGEDPELLSIIFNVSTRVVLGECVCFGLITSKR